MCTQIYWLKNLNSLKMKLHIVQRGLFRDAQAYQYPNEQIPTGSYQETQFPCLERNFPPLMARTLEIFFFFFRNFIRKAKPGVFLHSFAHSFALFWAYPISSLFTFCLNSIIPQSPIRTPVFPHI